MSLIVSLLMLWALFKGIRSFCLRIEKLCGGVTAKAFLVCVGILTVLVAVACSGVCVDWFLIIPDAMLAIACMLVIWKYVLKRFLDEAR